MSGHVVVNLINPLTAPALATPGTHDELILRAAGGETHPGLTLTAPSTAVSSYSLVYPNGTDIDLQYAINFAPTFPNGGGLTVNQTSVGNAINTIQTLQNSPAFRAIATNLFYLPNVATLAAAYDSLSGEGVSAAQQTAFTATDYFLSTINTQVQRWTGETCGDDSTSKTVYENPPGSLPTHKGEVAPACAYTRTWRIWGTGFGGGSHWPGDAVIGSAEADRLCQAARFAAAPLAALAARAALTGLLEAYLGRRSAARVQAGALRRGTGETIRAVLLSADLRDFTALSEATEPAAMIAALDAWFDRVAGAVHAFGVRC